MRGKRGVRAWHGQAEKGEARSAGARFSLSVRDGTDQERSREGARDGGAIRRSKCHTGTQLKSDATGSTVAKQTGSAAKGASRARQRQQSGQIASGAGTSTADSVTRYAPFSTVSQPSAPQCPVSSESQATATPTWSSTPAASKVQCCVPHSHRARARQASGRLRTRRTAAEDSRAAGKVKARGCANSVQI